MSVTGVLLACLFVIVVVLLGPHPRHMEVPSLGVESELQLPSYATATHDLICICDLHHSSWQHQILNLWSEIRDQTRNLLVPNRIRHDRNSEFVCLFVLMAAFVAYGNFWARDCVWGLAEAMLDHFTHCTRPGMEPTPPQWPELLQLDFEHSTHRGNSQRDLLKMEAM